MESLDFRKRLRFSAPEIAATLESKLMRDLVVNLRKLDDLGLADDYIKRAVLEKYSRESNAGDFGKTLGQDPMPVQQTFLGGKAVPVSVVPTSVGSQSQQMEDKAVEPKPAQNQPIEQHVAEAEENIRHDHDHRQATAAVAPMVIVANEAAISPDPPKRIPKTFQVM